jgi:hypothetical protein
MQEIPEWRERMAGLLALLNAKVKRGAIDHAMRAPAAPCPVTEIAVPFPSRVATGNAHVEQI